jgi:hypothetical protein
MFQVMGRHQRLPSHVVHLPNRQRTAGTVVVLECVAQWSEDRSHHPPSWVRITEKGDRLSATEDPISFEQHIKPLFRERDRQSMKWAFDLWSHDDVAGNSEAILGRLRGGTMPCDGAWPDERIAVFQAWVEAGTPA